MTPKYIYKATIDRVIDGDSIEASIDCGFDVVLNRQQCRLKGIDTAETRGGSEETKAIGKLAKSILFDLLPVGHQVVIETSLDRRGKFGRILAIVHSDQININQELLDRRLAVTYDGQSKAELTEQHLANYEYHAKKGHF